MLSIKATRCNGRCANCYERRIRAIKGNIIEPDIELLLDAIEKWPKHEGASSSPCIHGGEPLLFSNEDLDKLLGKIFARFGHSGIQSNGLLIDAEKIEIFKKNRTSVGISIDGDTAEMNLGRWNEPGTSIEDAESGTARVMENISALLEAKIDVSLMSSLWRYNGSAEMIDKFALFAVKMHKLGILHHTFHIGNAYDFTEAELDSRSLSVALRILCENCIGDPSRNWRPFRDIIDLMLGACDAVCSFNGCDPYHSLAEEPIFEDGSVGSCLRSGAAMDGICSIAPSDVYDVRSIILPQLSQDKGGCRGCHFWTICRGHCPGSAINQDWRLRSRFCASLYSLFEFIESKLRSMLPNIILSQDYGERPGIAHLLKSISKSAYMRSAQISIEALHQEKPPPCGANHGDSGHGDRAHGDSDDPAWRAAHPEWGKKNAASR